jgi:hypothetical protein
MLHRGALLSIGLLIGAVAIGGRPAAAGAPVIFDQGPDSGDLGPCFPNTTHALAGWFGGGGLVVALHDKDGGSAGAWCVRGGTASDFTSQPNE